MLPNVFKVEGSTIAEIAIPADAAVPDLNVIDILQGISHGLMAIVRRDQLYNPNNTAQDTGEDGPLADIARKLLGEVNRLSPGSLQRLATLRDKVDEIIHVWQGAPPGVGFGAYMEAACAGLQAALSEIDRYPVVTKGICGVCGEPTLSLNPHPQAGRTRQLLDVGAMYECIPCLVKTRHQYSQRANRAEKVNAFYWRDDDTEWADEKWLRRFAELDASECYLEINVPGEHPDHPAGTLAWLLDDTAPGGVLYMSINGSDLGHNIKTKGQVRRLFQALGLPSDVEWPKPEETHGKPAQESPAAG